MRKVGEEMSVLDYQDLTVCAQKIRKPGYWKLAALFGCGQSTVRDIVQYVTRYSA